MTAVANAVSARKSKQGEFENLVSIISIIAILVITGLIANLMSNSYLIPAKLPVYADRVDKNQGARTQARLSDKSSVELQHRFDQAIALLHAKQYMYAITALDRVLVLAPNMPEAYINMGFAYLGLKDYISALAAFGRASDLRVEQANTYWGMALAMEGLEDYEGALGAMRSYIHLSTPDDPFLPKARAALWEWEAKLGRIPGVGTAPDEQNKNNPD